MKTGAVARSRAIQSGLPGGRHPVSEKTKVHIRREFWNKKRALGVPKGAAEIQGIRIGESVLISAPMEILAETGLRLKKSSPFSHTLLASISTDSPHYAPPANHYSRGDLRPPKVTSLPNGKRTPLRR